MKFFLLMLSLLLPGVAHAQTSVAKQTSGSGTPTIAMTVPAGSPLSVVVTNGSRNPADWIGICNPGTPNTANCDGAGFGWNYLNCTQTKPAAGSASASCNLPAPNAHGNYIIGFFSNDGYTVLASAPFTVSGGTSATATIAVNGFSTGVTVTAGSTATVAVSGGGGPGYDNSAWMGFCNAGVTPSQTQCDYAHDWADVNNCQKAISGAATSSGSCPLAAPSENGAYIAAFFPNGSTYNPLATAPLTVTGGGGGAGGGGGGGTGGSGCTKTDSGLGASFGLTCQPAMSDDCNGSGYLDSNKWFNAGSPPQLSGAGYCKILVAGANGTDTTRTGWVSYGTVTSGEWYFEMQFKFNPYVTNIRFDNWFFACNSTNTSSLPQSCYQTKNNIPEIDINETMGLQQKAGAVLWVNNAGGGACGTNGMFTGTPILTDGTTHIFGMHVSKSSGTITWYLDGSVVNVASGCSPYIFSPTTSPFGQGYEMIGSGFCDGTGACTSGSYTSEQDIYYMHMYY